MGKGATDYLSKPKDCFPAFNAIWSLSERKKLFKRELWDSIRNSPAEYSRIDSFRENGSSDFVFNMQLNDMQRYMVGDILTKVDRASMQNSLEVRVPILDHEFAKLTFTIPSEMKLKGNNKKYIFKQAMTPFLPKSIISHKKRGFSVPLKLWFKDDLKEYVNDRLGNGNGPLYDYLNPTYVKQVIKDHNKGMRDFNTRIWSLIFLDQWLNSRR